MSQEIEKMRMEAEMERVGKYKQVALEYVTKYYDVCDKLVDLKLDQKPTCQFLMDYLRHLLQCGQYPLTPSHLSAIQPQVSNEEAHKCLSQIRSVFLLWFPFT